MDMTQIIKNVDMNGKLSLHLTEMCPLYSTLLLVGILHNVFDPAISPLPFSIIYQYFNVIPYECDQRV